MYKNANVDTIINNIEDIVLGELREGMETLSFIRGLVYGELDLPEATNLMTTAQRQLLMDKTLEFIFHLLKNRNCKVFSIEHENYDPRSDRFELDEWNLPPEEAIAKIKKIWLSLEEPMDPGLQPWISLSEEKPNDKESKK